MNRYVIYNKITGQIRASGNTTSSYDNLKKGLLENEDIIENVNLPNSNYKVENGQLVAITYSTEERNEKTAKENRQKRNQLLSSSDWTQIPDCTVDQTAWATYRQALRDITDNPYWPNLYDEHWPTQPE